MEKDIVGRHEFDVTQNANSARFDALENFFDLHIKTLNKSIESLLIELKDIKNELKKLNDEKPDYKDVKHDISVHKSECKLEIEDIINKQITYQSAIAINNTYKDIKKNVIIFIILSMLSLFGSISYSIYLNNIKTDKILNEKLNRAIDDKFERLKIEEKE